MLETCRAWTGVSPPDLIPSTARACAGRAHRSALSAPTTIANNTSCRMGRVYRGQTPGGTQTRGLTLMKVVRVDRGLVRHALEPRHSFRLDRRNAVLVLQQALDEQKRRRHDD